MLATGSILSNALIEVSLSLSPALDFPLNNNSHLHHITNVCIGFYRSTQYWYSFNIGEATPATILAPPLGLVHADALRVRTVT